MLAVAVAVEEDSQEVLAVAAAAAHTAVQRRASHFAFHVLTSCP